MQISKISELKKYKRFFAFGCSFTQYWWPTWADIIGNHISESYNYGMCGAGNTFIASSIIEANKRHKFNATDLILVMWTNIAREDRYVRNLGGWVLPGNIYSQPVYDSKFIEKFSCPRGYLLRDMIHIEASKILLESTGCDWDFMSMVPLTQISQYINNASQDNDILELFEDNLKLIKPSFYEIIYNFDYYSRKEYPIRLKYPLMNDPQLDIHPNPLLHLEYLNKIYPGISLDPNTKEEMSKITTELSHMEYVIGGMVHDYSISHGERFR